MTHGATLGGHVVKHAVERAGIDPARGRGRDDGLRHAREGAPARNIARQSRDPRRPAGDGGGVTVNRFCSSGLQTIAMAAQRIIAGEADVHRGRRAREHLASMQEGGRTESGDRGLAASSTSRRV